MLQKLINMIVTWIYRGDVAKFDQEYAELTRGEQFPDEDKISKQLDFAIKTFNGKKISTDFSSNNLDNHDVEMAGLDNVAD